ncbi:MAG: DUF2059 domain-containing protein [Candidatus Ratteibacteria bacterium]|jgi:hypothetical protein
MKKRMWVLAGVAAALLVSLPQNAKGDNRRALAEELMNVTHVQKTMEEAVAATKQMMKQMTSQTMKNAGINVSASAAAAQEKVTNAIMDLVTKDMGWDKIKDDYISMYADTYTEEEIQGQIDFYKSPIGQAVIGKQSEFMKKTMEMQQKRMMELMPKVQAIIKESIPKTPPPAAPPAPPEPPAPTPPAAK